MDGPSHKPYQAYQHLFTIKSSSYRKRDPKVLGMHNTVKDFEFRQNRVPVEDPQFRFKVGKRVGGQQRRGRNWGNVLKR